MLVDARLIIEKQDFRTCLRQPFLTDNSERRLYANHKDVLQMRGSQIY